ncbi:MAG: CDP-diacylglycerol--glycerol-3-phosphate 3-phosphatidyltransferase [Pseudomonadota bacterium]
MIWTLPNCLTLARILAAPVVGLLVIFGEGGSGAWAFAIFVAAALTDFFDGWLARKLNKVSPLGQMLDPIADKVMVTIVLSALISVEAHQTWLFVIPAFAILSREILVSGLREYLGDVKLKVTQIAKWKTTLQLTAIAGFLLAQALDGLEVLDWMALIALWAAGGLTVISGWDYFRKGVSLLSEREG